MENLLTVDFNQNKSSANGALLTLGNSNASLKNMHKPWNEEHIRVPWDLISEKYTHGGNLFFTINPDPNVDWYTHNTDKKTIFTKYLTMMEKLKSSQIIKKSICVYEYGKYGRCNGHGKLHFHGFVLTKDKQSFEKEVYKVFNNTSNAKHRTLNLKIIKSAQDRQNMLNYFKKENQNKIKCFYYN